MTQSGGAKNTFFLVTQIYSPTSASAVPVLCCALLCCAVCTVLSCQTFCFVVRCINVFYCAVTCRVCMLCRVVSCHVVPAVCHVICHVMSLSVNQFIINNHNHVEYVVSCSDICNARDKAQDQ